METISNFLIWISTTGTDAFFAGAYKNNLILSTVFFVCLAAYVKKTKSTWDDEVIDKLKKRLFGGEKE